MLSPSWSEASMKRMRQFATAFVLTALVLFACHSSAQDRSTPKRFRNSHSEFLRRAALQPVDWYPLGPEAMAIAKQAGKPMLVKVGASWCPFCEAMDREGYGKDEIAQFINQHFIAVRIDYDGQPELAHKLELAQALANLPSGLPLTMFVTPEGKLYEGGGYFPPAPAKYKPSFAQFLQQASSEFETKRFRVELRDINSELMGTR
jgi:uncharacterized protein YyaL (SSP411 family)